MSGFEDICPKPNNTDYTYDDSLQRSAGPPTKRFWCTSETPYPKKVLYLPQVLSQQEVARLIDAAQRPFHRILLMTLYATGARRMASLPHRRQFKS